MSRHRSEQRRQGVVDEAFVCDRALDDVAFVAAGNFHVFAMTHDVTLLAWGDNEDGQLGIGLFETVELTPMPVTGF